MDLAQILSRLPIEGATNIGGTPAYENYIPILDADGLMPVAMMPPITITSIQVVADMAERLALTNVEPGDCAKQSDNGITYMLKVMPPTADVNWVSIGDTEILASDVIVTPAGNITSTDGQNALEELDDLMVHKDTDDTITAQHTFAPTVAQPPFVLGANAQGETVTGFDADTLDGLHGPTTDIVGVDDGQILTNKTLTTPTIGDFTNANHDHEDAAGGANIASTAVSDFTTAAEDAAGNLMVTGSTDVDLTYVANTSITATLTDTTVVANTYGSATQSPQLTVDAKGRITGVTDVTISGVTPAAHASTHVAAGTDPVITAPTKILYVDGNRGDTYTADGSVQAPYKTIQAAINQIAALAPTTYYTVDIANGIYAENVVLENAGLKYIKLQGNGYVSINPVAGNSLQSAATNDNLKALLVDNVIFSKPVVIQGSNGVASFVDSMWSNVSFTGTGTFSATCINNITMRNVYSECAFTYVNVNWSYIESGQLQGTFSFTMDDTLSIPSSGGNGTILANGVFQSGAVSYTIGGTATYTVAPQACRWGSSAALTVPAGVSILAYSSWLRGTHTNNGAITLRNANLEGYTAGTGTLTMSGQPATQVSNTPAGSISSTDVQAAINELDTDPRMSDARTPTSHASSHTTGSDLIYSSVPAGSSANGTAGQIAYDSNYIYICTATGTPGTWKRAALATW